VPVERRIVPAMMPLNCCFRILNTCGSSTVADAFWGGVQQTIELIPLHMWKAILEVCMSE
jgi:hypothetical protein